MMGGEACLQFVQSTCTVLARIVLDFLCNAGGGDWKHFNPRKRWCAGGSSEGLAQQS